MLVLEILLVAGGYFAAVGALAYWATGPTASASRVWFCALIAFLFGFALLGLITYGIWVKVWRGRGRVSHPQPQPSTAQAVPATWGQQG